MRTFTSRDVEFLRSTAWREEQRAFYLQPHDRHAAEERVLQLRELADAIDSRVKAPENHTLDLPEGGASVVVTWRGIRLEIITRNGFMYVESYGEDKQRSQWPEWLAAYEVDLALCDNCGQLVKDHCKVHTIPCCPGKCPLEGPAVLPGDIHCRHCGRDLDADHRCPRGHQ